MPTLELKPTHKVVAAYYDNLEKFARLGIKHSLWEAKDSADDRQTSSPLAALREGVE